MQEVLARSREDVAEALRHLQIHYQWFRGYLGGPGAERRWRGEGRAGERGMGEVAFLFSNCYRLLLILH